MKKILICLMGIIIFNVSFSLSLREEVKKDFNYIEEMRDEMLEDDGTTYGMKRATAEEYEAVDDLLNKYYRKLLNHPPLSKQKKEIIEAQREWIKFRDKEFDLYDSHFSAREGSIMPVFLEKLKIRFIKNRILEFVALGEYSAHN